MPAPLAQLSAAGAPGRRRRPHTRRGQPSPKRTLSVPADLDRLIAAEAEATERTYAAVVVERLAGSYGPDAEPEADPAE